MSEYKGVQDASNEALAEIKGTSARVIDIVDLDGAATVGINIGQAITTGIAIGATTTTAVSLTGTATTGMSLSGTKTTAIDIAGTHTKGVNLSSATMTAGADNALIAIGTWNSPKAVVMDEAYIPLQINLSNTGNVAKDIAAARLKVISANAQASVNSNVLELRHTISGNVAQWCTLQCSAAPAAHTVGTGEGLVSYFKMEGSGTLTPAGSNAIAVMEVINEHLGAGVSDVFIARNNATGYGATNIAKIENIIGTATNGVYVLKTAGTLTNGISISGPVNGIVNTSTATGIGSTVSTYVGAQWSDSAHHFHVTSANCRNENGVAGYFQADLTGTVAGTLYGFGSWINMMPSSVAGANLICAQDNGVWADSTSNVSAGQFVIGMRMEFVVTDGDNPGALYLFSTNIYDNVLTALFHVNAIGDMGGSTGTKSGGTARYVPLFYDVTAGVTHYINTYTA